MAAETKTDIELLRAEPQRSEAQTEVQVLQVKSRFAMLAKREGGKKSAAALLQAADAFLRDEKDRYQSWLADALRRLDHTLDELPGTIPDALQLAYRQAAEIRDLGGTFGAPQVTAVADSLCELLYRLHSAGLYNAQAIAMHLSALRLVCAADTAGDKASAALLAGLRQMVAKYPQPQATAKPQAAAH